MTKIAAIDIGTNGMRLLIATLREDGTPRTELRERVRIRFGQDVFQRGGFRSQTLEQATSLLGDFSQSLKREQVRHCLCVATSAFRDAENASQFAQMIQQRFQLNLNIISGQMESELVLAGVAGEILYRDQPYVLIDVGGGSTEVILAQRERSLHTLSINIGTVRLLVAGEHSREGKKLLDSLQREVANELLPLLLAQEHPLPVPIVGTGGNLRRLGKLKRQLLGKDDPGSLRNDHFHLIMGQLLRASTEQRVARWGLHPDRAQVIAPACCIIQACLQNLPWESIQIPQGGLVDGVLQYLAHTLGEGPQLQGSPLSLSTH